jgi:hypothetical protein
MDSSALFFTFLSVRTKQANLLYDESVEVMILRMIPAQFYKSEHAVRKGALR